MTAAGRRWISPLLAAISTILLATTASTASPNSFDTILRHGLVFDGSGAPGFHADIGIRDGKIAAIGDLGRAHAATIMDVAGLAVAPGFINIHDHPVPAALLHSTNMLMQGVTTEIFNPDGGGVPGTNAIDLSSQLSQLSAHGLGTNIGGYIGFNAVWESVIGKTNRIATADEIQRMRDLVTRNLQAGAFGVSAGLDYKPGYYASTDEVVAVVSAARDWRTNFPNHERLTPESGFSSRAGIRETITIGERAGLSPEITHMKAQGHEQGDSPEILAMMSAATAQGHYTPSDLYPYVAGETGLEALLVPGWALEGGREAMLKRFADPVLRQRIAGEIEAAMKARVGGPQSVYLPVTRQQLTAIMRDMNVGAGEAVMRMLEKAAMPAILAFGSDADVVNFMKYPATAIACDCGANENGSHPRYNGTFTRVLGHYVRETHVITLADAVRKMTGLPASTVGLVDRGFIAAGMAADITVFDPDTVTDHATYENPSLPSTGIVDVLVNGVVAVRDGKPTGSQGGSALRRSEHMPTRPLLAAARTLSAKTMLILDGNAGSGRALITLRQAEGAHSASGRFLLFDNGGHLLLSLSRLGILQVADGWATLTGEAQLGPGAPVPVTVIIDKADPLANKAMASISVDGDGVHMNGRMPADQVVISIGNKAGSTGKPQRSPS